ncbi:TIGR02234 family membrane protein [Rhodococcus chondri]|uniref:TIGR02234 family membrane protein n=1 Tax=Rhodococcus chondri TaxID=3065941 RepID=A0ABU7JUV7_9NOCA|nr:TIGR02234 family membrane protein [Rhodococcus sp. CC-R104]MEE2033803.1 TIGR02234 family membrane protein [Rhodococcus sp. CC-R104]
MTAPASGSSPRRRPTVAAALLLAVAAGALWAAGRMTWVRVESADGLGTDRVTDLTGSVWAAATTPLALALLAAVAAVFAVRGRALRVLAVAVALVAVAAAIPSLQLVAGEPDDDTAARVAELPDRATVTATEVSYAPALLALAGACLALAAAVALWRTPRAHAGLSSKYESPAARREASARAAGTDEPVTERSLWDALDAGVDPTADPGDDGHDGQGTGDSGTRRRPS